MSSRRLRAFGLAFAIAVCGTRSATAAGGAAMSLVPPKPDVLLGVSDRGATEGLQRLRRTDRQAPGPDGDLLRLGQHAQQGLRTVARNADPAGRRDLDPERADAGRDHHPRADRARRRRRLPAAAEQLLRDPRPARLHPAAGRAEPLPERLGGGRMRRDAERRRTQRLLVQGGLPADRRDRPRRPDPRRHRTRRSPKSACRRSHRTKGANPESLPAAPVSIIWSPLPAGSPRVKGNFPGNYWPGSKWVDWVGTDFYAKYPVWEDLNRFYEGAQWRNKPVAITEWAMQEKDEPRFVKQLISWVITHKRVQMLTYYQGFGARQHLRTGPLSPHRRHLPQEDPPRQLPLLRRIQRRPPPPAPPQGKRTPSQPGLDVDGPKTQTYRQVFGPSTGGRSCASEEGLDGEGEAAGFAFDLLPGAAGDAPAGRVRSCCSRLRSYDEGAVGVVEAPAVGFDDQPRFAPEEVGLVALAVRGRRARR